MLITKTVLVKWHGSNKKYYISKGYPFTKIGDEFEVKLEDLTPKAHIYVEVKCDNENCDNPIVKPVKWDNYTNYIKEDGKYFCQNCAMKLYARENALKKRLKNSKSFEQWCIENNRHDILDRWDYDLNNKKPNEVTYSSNKKYYFKCPLSKHPSEEKYINNLTKRRDESINCNYCDSFAEYLIEQYGENTLDKYWSKDNNISPYNIFKRNKTRKILIICQEKDYHGSYPITADNFVAGRRCGYCNTNGEKVHTLDSIGKILEDKDLLCLWSKKNKKSPYEYSAMSNQWVWWKCYDNKHKDYFRSIVSSHNICGFRCPECQYSKGEERISDYYINKGFNKVSQEEFEQLIDKDKYNKDYYIPQMKYDGLIGLNGGLLSYDFYLPSYNLLIEYDGEYHFKPIKLYKNEPIKYAEERFERQKEHDRRKDDYAKYNNIKLLRIPYWEFDNIEEILENNLKK